MPPAYSRDASGIPERPGRASRIGSFYPVAVSVGRASRTPEVAQLCAARGGDGAGSRQPGVAHDEPAVRDVGDPAAQEPGEIGAGRQVVHSGEVGVVGDSVRPEAAQQRARPQPGDDGGLGSPGAQRHHVADVGDAAAVALVQHREQCRADGADLVDVMVAVYEGGG